MSTLFVDTINEKTSGNGIAIPGHVVQVVSTSKTDGFSTSSSSYTDVTGLSVTITPKFSNSKILITVSTAASNNTASRVERFRLLRGTTWIAKPDSDTQSFAGSMTVYDSSADVLHTVHCEFLDSPATTSATTYKVQCSTNGGTMFVNRRASNDMARHSSITAVEIAQ